MKMEHSLCVWPIRLFFEKSAGTEARRWQLQGDSGTRRRLLYPSIEDQFRYEKKAPVSIDRRPIGTSEPQYVSVTCHTRTEKMSSSSCTSVCLQGKRAKFKWLFESCARTHIDKTTETTISYQVDAYINMHFSADLSALGASHTLASSASGMSDHVCVPLRP